MSDPKLKPCPLCSSTNIRMLEPELLDTDAWNCAIECLDCQIHIGPSYCEPDPVTARYSAQVDWNRRPSAKSHADEREQFLMANLLAALEVALGDVTALAIVDRVRQVADRIHPTSSLSPVPQAWLDVQAERRRQITVEGFDTSKDDASGGQIAQAAGCYALHAGGIGTDWPGGIRNGSALFWPWNEEWWKPKSARENLVRAGALVLAEIERLDRSATEQGSTCCKGGRVMDKQKVLAKVEKLMALANAKGATPNEAETALRQAAILKRQFDLSDADISAHTVETACVPTRTRRSPAPWLHELAGICASSFGCDYLAAYAMPAGWTFKFMGRGIGPELAAHAYSTLHHQLVAARSAHVAQQKRCKLSTKRRRSKLFVEGWLLAVRSLVRDFAGKPDESTQAAIKAYLELHHPELKLLEPAAPTKPLAYDQASLHAGWEHGKNSRMHRGIGRRVQGALEHGGSR